MRRKYYIWTCVPTSAELCPNSSQGVADFAKLEVARDGRLWH